jgi:hypothetical protein
MGSISAKLDAIYGSPTVEPVRLTPAVSKVKFETREQIDKAFAAGEITKGQASAYRAWITMRERGGKIVPPAIEDTEDHTLAFDRSMQIKGGSRITLQITDVRSVVGGTVKTGTIVRRFWDVEVVNGIAGYWMNTTDWGREGLYPEVGDIIEATVSASLKWHLQLEPDWIKTGVNTQIRYLWVEAQMMRGR